MRVTLTLETDLEDQKNDQLRYDIRTWLQLFARDQWRKSESEDSNGKKLITFEFRHPLDAMDFYLWRDIYRYGRLL